MNRYVVVVIESNRLCYFLDIAIDESSPTCFLIRVTEVFLAV